MEVESGEHVELESGEFGRDGWLFCQEGNISPQSRICVHTESWNWWHISNCTCWTDTESFRTQFFKAQISSKLLWNTFYTSKYKSFSATAYWPGANLPPEMFWTNFVTKLSIFAPPPPLSNISNHSNVFISKEDIYKLQFCVNIYVRVIYKRYKGNSASSIMTRKWR